MQVSGQFLLQVIKSNGSLRSFVNQENLVLNGLWNCINEESFPSRLDIQLGIGNSEPNVNDVTLNEFLYECSGINPQIVPGVDDGDTLCLRYYAEIPAGEISEDVVNLREIGLFASNKHPHEDALITRSLIDSENNGQQVKPSDMVKITYDLRFTAPSGLMPQTSSLVINGVEHQVSYKVAKLGEINIQPPYLLGSHRVRQGTGSVGSYTNASGWNQTYVREVTVDREEREIQVIWEADFDEFLNDDIEQIRLRKGRPSSGSGGYIGTTWYDYVTVIFDPPIAKREGERLTLNGVFKTTLNF